ncbi:MAG: polysaccharide pyruvyl transferase family protein [Candidatus Omnitrophica bacterium]|nr:polysaccharide pyruvyl transferase family protein [Candidatus Omnitrophota bacterium]
MKIGILTVNLNFNYGGILQAYALQAYLKRCGHEAWLIVNDRNRQSLSFSAMLEAAARDIYGAEMPTTRSNFEREIICQNTAYFMRKYINPVTGTIESRKAVDWLDIYNFDAYIVGSDQVWRKGFTKKKRSSFFEIFKSMFWPRPMFLDFVKSDKIKRITYAASFGIDEWEYDRCSTKKMANLLRKFDAVSVREDSGVRLCKDYLGVNAIHVIDPTLLLSSSEYMELCKMENTPKSRGDMMIYLMDETREGIAGIIAKKKRLSPFSVNAKTKSSKAPLEDRIYPPVTDWIRGFFDAKFVVTDSFHGCAFSIIFNKPFLAIGNKSGGMARFYSLLKMFGLEDRLILDIDELKDDKILTEINFDKINQILKIKQQEASDFLREALK